MKQPIDQLKQAKGILNSVLGVAIHNMGGSVNVQEAKGHIRQAIHKLENEQKKQIRKKKDQPSPLDHWKDVLANVPSTPMANTIAHTQQAPHKTLDQLNSMIDEEKQKLAELEAKSQESQTDNLLTD